MQCSESDRAALAMPNSGYPRPPPVGRGGGARYHWQCSAVQRSAGIKAKRKRSLTHAFESGRCTGKKRKGYDA